MPLSFHSHSNESIVIPLNTPQNLHCTFSGKPAPQITWYKLDGNRFKKIKSVTEVLVTANRSRVSMLESNVVFANANRFDGGLYMCSAASAVWKSEKNITLNVTCKYSLLFLHQRRTLGLFLIIIWQQEGGSRLNTRPRQLKNQNF